MPKVLLEVAVFNVQSALMAAQAGANRLELCENPADGGTSPSYGTLLTIKKQVHIPVFPIIRPRGGDFLYTAAEAQTMLADVLLCKKMGFEGVVSGALQKNGSINLPLTQQLIEAAYPMEFTFHRAFDRCRDPFEALEQLMAIGCTRILTSGQVPNAWDGRDLIKALQEKANQQLVILPGSGVRSNNIADIVQYTQVTEIHSSARKLAASTMEFNVLGMQEKLQSTQVDTTEIRSMLDALEH
jgi:copper homeostasis protein